MVLAESGIDRLAAWSPATSPPMRWPAPRRHVTPSVSCAGLSPDAAGPAPRAGGRRPARGRSCPRCASGCTPSATTWPPTRRRSPPGECQVVFCRNVLIYFGHDDVVAFLDRLSAWLPPGGLPVPRLQRVALAGERPLPAGPPRRRVRLPPRGPAGRRSSRRSSARGSGAGRRRLARSRRFCAEPDLAPSPARRRRRASRAAWPRVRPRSGAGDYAGGRPGVPQGGLPRPRPAGRPPQPRAGPRGHWRRARPPGAPTPRPEPPSTAATSAVSRGDARGLPASRS